MEFALKYKGTKVAEQIANVPQRYLPIVEIFYGIEGEGSNIGTPQTFVRVGGCLVGCKNCDSPHTWSLKRTTLMSIESILDRCAENPTKIISLTGGEPLHYETQVNDFCVQAQARGFTVCLETSGQIVSGVLNCVDFVSFDIKTPSSGVAVTEEQIQHILEVCGTNRTTSQIKMVVSDSQDLAFVTNVLEIQRRSYTFHGPNLAQIILTPAAGALHSVEHMRQIMGLVLTWNKFFRIRVIPQIHVLLGMR